jgi:adenylosuccinate synthase
MIKTDVVTDLLWGDNGKGKITHSLMKNNKYDYCLKLAGSANAGHTIYHNGDKFVTHLLPAGIFFNIPSIIGRNCLVHPETLFAEIEQLQNQFNKHEDLKSIDIQSLVKIDKNTCIITDDHIYEDSKDTIIGSTKRGVGPAARDKYARTAVQVQNVDSLKGFVVDFPEIIYQEQNASILGEGAQGFYLDVNFGDYPYVTSTHCSLAAVPLSGIPIRSIDRIFGAIKIYATYVGKKSFQGEDSRFDMIAEAGSEFGSTTGRKRQVNWLDLDKLIYAIKANDVTDLIISKIDIFRKLNIFVLVKDNKIIEFNNEKNMKTYIHDVLYDSRCNSIKNIVFSESPHDI